MTTPSRTATATTDRLYTEILLASLEPGAASNAASRIAGRLVVRLCDAGLSLRSVAARTGLAHPQRKLDGRRALTVADLDAFAFALGLDLDDLLAPAVDERDQDVLTALAADTDYDADGEVTSGADVAGIEPLRLGRLAAQGLVARCDQGGYIVTPAGVRALGT